MCKCTPQIRTPFCGKPGCEWPDQKPASARGDVPSINGWTPPVIYDISSDEFRIATQEDISRLEEVNRAYGELIGKCREILAAHDALVAKVRADHS